MTINENLLNDIIGYCELNNIDHVKWINDILKENLMLLKYQQYYPSNKPQQSENKENINNHNLPETKKVNNKNNNDFYGE